MPTRILIADDHGLFRAGLDTLLKTEPDLEIVGRRVPVRSPATGC